MRRWGLVLVAMGGLVGACCGCGGAFDAVDRVVSIDGAQVCVANIAESSGTSRRCLDVAKIDDPDGMVVGACVLVRHQGESARILRVKRVVTCPNGATTSTD